MRKGDDREKNGEKRGEKKGKKRNKLGLSWAKLRLTNLELNWFPSDPLQTEEGPGGKWGDADT